MLVQVPALAVIAHDWQVPLHELAQQTPCAQMPELHSSAVVQPTPSPFLEQVLPLQTLGGAQSALVWHVVLQTLALASQT